MAFMEFKLLEEFQKLIIYFLQMIASFFVGTLFKILRPFKKFLILTNQLLVNLLIWINLKSLLAEMYLVIVKSCSKVGCKLRLLSVIRSIWGFLLLLVGLRNKFSILSKTGCGRSWKVGKKNFYQLLAEKVWSNQWFKRFLHMRWVVFYFRWVYVSILKVWLVSSGKVTYKVSIKLIGLNGRHYVRKKKKGAIGFRTFHEFNLATLSKQDWPIMHKDDLLISQCLKARYFPRSNFLKASTSYYPSYTWRSMQARVDVIGKAGIWEVVV